MGPWPDSPARATLAPRSVRSGHPTRAHRCRGARVLLLSEYGIEPVYGNIDNVLGRLSWISRPHTPSASAA